MSAKESLDYYELKKHNSWFDKGCSKLLDQWRRAKLQSLQNPGEINSDNLNNLNNLNNARRETTRYIRNTKGEYMKDKINELEQDYSRPI
jgi:queuine/archaeosine tRNA-ribosyltransferase